MIKLILATKNKGKVKEFEEILSVLPAKVVSMGEAGIDTDIDEHGATFEENALIKAREICKMTGELVIADDSGLEVDYLDGAPGVYSSRFGGEGATDSDKNIKLLGMLKDVPEEKRTGRFVCAIAVVLPEGKEYTVRGVCEGRIGYEPAGDHGFGYDPIFYIPEYGKTMAELEPDLKNRISHRARALSLMVEVLRKKMIFDLK